MGPELLLGAATAFQAVGSIAQGEQQASEYKAAARAADYNAKAADIQARQSYDIGTQNELSERRRGAQIAGQTRAAVGDSGFVSGSGSALAIQEQSVRDMELDALQQRYQGLIQGGAYEQEASMQRYRSKSLKANAKAAKVSGYMGAASSLLSGGVKAYDMGLIKKR